jgi:hypothetical protein
MYKLRYNASYTKEKDKEQKLNTNAVPIVTIRFKGSKVKMPRMDKQTKSVHI